MHRLTGLLLVALSAASFGTLAIFARYAYADGMDTFTMLFLRFAFAALLMLVLLAIRRERFPRGATLWQLIGMGAVGYVAQSFCYFTATRYASAGLVALLLYLYPVFVAVLAAVFLREAVTRHKVLALLLALAGTALTVGPAGGQAAGILLAVSAAAIYSVYIIVGARVMRQVSAIQSSTVIFGAAAAAYGVLSAVNGPHPPATGTGWAVMAAMVLIPTVVAVVAFLAGLERIGPTNAAMLSTLEPVITVGLAAACLHETLAPLTWLGGGLILAAVLVLTRGEWREAPPREEHGATIAI